MVDAQQKARDFALQIFADQQAGKFVAEAAQPLAKHLADLAAENERLKQEIAATQEKLIRANDELIQRNSKALSRTGAVTEAMVEAAAASLRPDLFTPIKADVLQSDDYALTCRRNAKIDVMGKARAALSAAARVRAEANNECGEAAYPAPQPSVKVKALEWKKPKELRFRAACTHFGYEYFIDQTPNGWLLQTYLFGDEYWETLGSYPALDDAMYAAQADYERRILSALTAGKPEQSGWQPIETAPRDGTRILAWTPAGHDIVWWSDLEPDGPEEPGHNPGWWGACGETAPGRTPEHGFGGDPTYHWPAQSQPTHWMPLPTPPTAGGGDE